MRLLMDDAGGLTIMPLVGGKIMGDEEYGRLAPARRKLLKTKGEHLLSEISVFLRKLTLSEQGFRQRSADNRAHAGYQQTCGFAG